MLAKGSKTQMRRVNIQPTVNTMLMISTMGRISPQKVIMGGLPYQWLLSKAPRLISKVSRLNRTALILTTLENTVKDKVRSGRSVV